MATTTTNLGLTKPDAAENYDVGVFNGNADTLDAVYGEVGVALDDRVKRADFDERAAVVDASLNSIVQEITKLTPEHGIWTPDIYGETAAGTVAYSDRAGYYLRNGNSVFISGNITISSISDMTGYVLMRGLPFPVGRPNNVLYVPSLSFRRIILADGATGVSADIIATNFRFFLTGSDKYVTPLLTTYIQAGTTIHFSATYLTGV